jgi:hypothetical protein
MFPGCFFAMGYDTAARLVQTKYYNDSVFDMADAFAEVRRLGCRCDGLFATMRGRHVSPLPSFVPLRRFVVAGRVSESKFLTLADVDMPASLRDLFLPVTEAEFRVDVSSTSIRAGSTST